MMGIQMERFRQELEVLVKAGMEEKRRTGIQAFCREHDLSYATFHQIATNRGGRRPKLNTLKVFAQALGIDVAAVKKRVIEQKR